MANKNFRYTFEEDGARLGQPPEEDTNKSPQHSKKASKDKSLSRRLGEESTPRNKLIEQHSRLKAQLKELALKMDHILEKEKERKDKKHIMTPAEEDERIQELKKQLREQETRINRNKAEITKLRRNLDSKYDINKIVEKENELKHLKKQLQSLEEEKEGLEKIRRMQDKANNNAEDKQTAQKVEKMEQELRELGHKTKKQLECINEKEKQIRKLHEAYMIKEERVREIQRKGKQRKSFGQEINEYSIAQLQEQIKNLENERIQVQKEGNERIKALEKQRKELRNEIQRKKLILDDKQKQLRLNQIKHKQIVKIIGNSNQEHDSLSQSNGKRVISKKGREAPRIQTDQHTIDDN